MDRSVDRTHEVRPTPVSGAGILAILAILLYAGLQLGGLGYPLLWQDEGETAMFGRRILDHGYPKVHGAEGVVYGMGIPLEFAVDPESDAYTGSLWGQYYLAAFGVWLAEDIDDLHRRTAALRLPFVLLGLCGLALLFLSIRPALARGSGSSAAALALFALLLCLSTSLILHLREVRYYAPGLALLAAIVWLELRRPPALDSPGPGRAALLGGALLLLFNFFPPAAAAAALWVGLEWMIRARSSPGSWAGPLRRAVPLGVALAVFAAVAVGIALYFRLPALSGILAERWGFGPGLYAANLVALAGYLLRYEFLAPLLLAEGMLFWRARRAARAAVDAELLGLRASILRLALVFALVGAANPIFFERYFVPMGPLIALAVVLDLEVLWRGVRPAGPPARFLSPLRTFAGLWLLVVVGVVLVRAEELVGRGAEILRPVRGPVEAVTEFVQTRYADPSALLIATNYEAESLMYYLGSRVIGRFHGDRPEEAALRPGLVVPRTAQPRNLQAVKRYLLGGGYARHPLAVADVAYNNIPELSSGRVLTTTHRFATPVPGDAGPALAVYESRDPSRD